MFPKFLVLDKGVDRIGYWYGFYLLVSGALTWLSKNSPFLGDLSWPESILIGMVGAPLVGLVFTACLACWRYFNPLPSAPLVASTSADFGAASTDLATLRSRLTKSQDDLAHLLAVTDGLRAKIETAEASLGKQIVDLDEKQSQTVAELKEAQRRLDSVIRVGKSAVFAAEMLPRAQGLLAQAETETKRTPPRLPADGEFIVPFRREPTEIFGELRGMIQTFQNQLGDHFAKNEIGQLTGGLNVEGLGRAVEIPLVDGDEAFFRDGAHKLNWARFMDEITGTHSRMTGLISFLESKRNIDAELAKVE